MVIQEFSSLAELLDFRAATAPDQVAYTFLQDGVTPSDQLTYGELGRRARTIAASLRHNVRPGDRVLLLHPPGLGFVAALFACFEAEATPVPAYPPGRRGDLQLEAIFRDSRPAAVLTTDTIAAALPDGVRQALRTDSAQPHRHGDTTCIPTGYAGASTPPAEHYALLQYTSGSTSTPKGVMVTHHNLLANSAVIRSAFDLSPTSVSVSWLPAYHDMGLIDGILQPLYTGFPAYLMPPTAFLKAPARWLQAVSRYRATHSGGPNFAYTLCTERTTAADREGLDLSCWHSAYNGAEPIRSSTLRDFAEAFSPHGFRSRAFYPCYGLAEATLMVTGTDPGTGPTVRSLATAELSTTAVARDAAPDEATSELVSSGRTHGDVQLRIMNPESRRACPPGQVGEIWVAGPSAAAGYWNLRDQSRKTFGAYPADSDDGPYLRTGDLGFLDGTELFVTGRLKDLIIIRGRNYYPQDLERTVDGSDPAIRTGCAAAFAVPGHDSEQLVVVCELTPEASTDHDAEALVRTIRRSIREHHSLPVGAVALLPTGRVPKTSSGKIRRRESRTRYLEGTLGELHLSVFAPREAPTAPVGPPRATLLTVPARERTAWLTAYLTEHLADPDTQPSPERAAPSTLIDQGIDSLAAAHLAHRMSAELGVPVPLTLFLENSTVEEVAQHLLSLFDAASTESAEAERDSVPGPDGSGTQTREREQSPDRPVSVGEQALWFLHTAEPDSAAYNTCYAARLPDDVDLAALRTALSSLSERHTALRTTFPATDGRPRAVVHDVLPLPLTHEHGAPDGTTDPHGRIVEFRDQPFDLEHGPLIRALIIDSGPAGRILVLAAHHIVVDLWSLRILVEDLQRDYAGEAAQPGPWELGDYTRWAADPTPVTAPERQGQYWFEQLADAPTVFPLPYDRPRPAIRRDSGASLTQELSDELLTELKSFAKRSGVTPYTLFLAAYQALLHRYTASTDFLIGTPAAARTRPELASLVGYLANQLVLRTRIPDNPSFATHLARTRESVLGALAHQDFPFPQLVERLKPSRDPSHTPLFQVMFAYEKMPSGNAEHLPLATIAVPSTAARFDLTLVCVEQDGRVSTRWEYSSDLFDHHTIERIGRHFLTLLTHALRDAEQPVGSLQILSGTEQRNAVADWNGTPAPAADTRLHQLIAAHATGTPDAVAVRSGDVELSYRELDEHARLLAGRLAQHSIGPGARVAVCLRRSADLVVALLAVLRRGAAFVPTDPAHPDRRITRILDDTGAAAVLTLRETAHRIAAHHLAICVDEPAKADRPPHVVDADVDPDALAYVLYTSGSTGEPKGVMVSHRAIVNYLAWAADEYRIVEGAGAPVSSSITFDATLTSLFGPLVAGRTVTLLSEHAEITGLRDLLLGDERQSLVKATPSQLDLLRAVLPAEAKPLNVGALVVGGEAFPAESLAFWRQQSPGTRIYNEYGPTEATVGCCVHEATAHPEHPSGVPIGRAIANAEIYVLDALLNITPIGVPGEIYIGGTGLARGYLDRPALTAERFVPHPFRAERGARLYRTGDRARYLADGTLEYLGRDDDQVKIRGIRVELGEIEALLQQHAAVREAAVIASADTSVDRRLTAHIVTAAGAGSEIGAELRTYLAQRLPHPMVPTAFIPTPALPRTAHGKIDRAALQHIAPPPRADALPAPTDLEDAVAGVWREVLETDVVDPDANFFDLGGTSALAAEVQAKLGDTLNRKISLVALFQHATIASLARHLAGPADSTATGSDADRVQRRTRALQRRKRA
ncbi:amino acid adenylation domain-containing protein [Streptomyces sp. NPDC088755]|uniref:amino acid adenylation domain-containing protein n=1 Tax=Streptomyces sp. NPDC088755 TaxID=3365888 RepID=UPI003812E7B0